MRSANDLHATWQCPPSIYRSAPFWSWNSKLSPERLCRAIESMHQAGMGGFFMHSRYGLKTPYLSAEWFQCVSACVETARRLGMKAYLYDEDRWPSGTAGGIVTRSHPEFGGQLLEAGPPDRAGDEAERLALFALRFDGAGKLTNFREIESPGAAAADEKVMALDVRARPKGPWYNDGAYLDTMNAEAVAEFIHVTHQAYADRYGKDFGEVIPAIFTDEPYYGKIACNPAQQVQALLWTPELPQQFKRRRGYDLREHLPELFCPLAGGEFSKVRCDYYRTVTELFVENFSAQVGRWCGKHRIALTGHMLAEGTLLSQIGAAGAAMPHYEHMQWPGIDLLTDQAKELMTAKQCSSVADQLGKQRVLSELYGCTGWDWPLEGHKFVGDWQFAAGVNFRCPHLTHYSLAGGGKRDYPASIFTHSPWWKYYNVVEDYFARLSLMLTQGRPLRDVLVIHPIESAWGTFWPQEKSDMTPPALMQQSLERLMYSLTGEHYDWDFGDESLLAKYAKLAGGKLKVGKMTYQLVIVPPSITLRSTTLSLLRRLLGDGGKVLFIGRVPDRVDGKASDQAAELVAAARTCGDQADQFIPAIEALLPRRVSVTEDGAEQKCIWSMLRSIKGGQLLFLQSHDRTNGRRVHVSALGRRPVVLWDAHTGQQVRVRSESKGERIEFDLDLPATGSALVSLGLAARGAINAPAKPKVLQSKEIAGPYEFELLEPNTFPLDYCRYRVGDGEFSELVPTLKADELIRKAFGLQRRGATTPQPWYLYATGVIDTSPRGKCQMKWTFHVTDVPAACKLALESPENYQITINGVPAGGADGYWVDEEIKTIDISSQLRTGENEILLSFDYRPDMELEDMYLVGDFGAAKRRSGPAAPDNITVVKPPKTLNSGSWVGQGLDFYGGAVRYRLQIERPAGRRRVRVRLPNVACTAAAFHVGGRAFVLPWAPFEADITDAMTADLNEVFIEVIGGRKNILGPLHTPWEAMTGPRQFDPSHGRWTHEYLLNDHGLNSPVIVETLR